MPEFSHNGHAWRSRIEVPFWAEYRNRCAAPAATNGGGGAVGGGWVDLVFAPEGRDDAPLTPEECTLVDVFLARERQISNSVRATIFAHYGLWQRQYGFAGDVKERFMPDIRRPDELRDLIALKTLYVHQLHDGGTPYSGFEFDCSWDDENGLGVLTCGTRTVEAGPGEIAFELWRARRDALD